MTADSSFHAPTGDPANQAAVAAGHARDDVVSTAMELAGQLRADMRIRHDVSDEAVADQLVSLVIVCEHYAECARTLNAIMSEHAR